MSTNPLTLVLTHGRGQVRQVAAEEARIWTEALQQGLGRLQPPYTAPIDTAFAFYGDLWLPDWDQTSLQSTSGGSSTERQAVLAADMLTALGQPAQIAQGTRQADVLAALIRRLDEHFRVGELVLRLFLSDLDQFLTRDGLRAAALNILRSTIQNISGPVALLAHSMGTVVGYELLRRQPPPNVQAFITFGSVLGYPTVRRRLARGGGDPPYPGVLPRWINIYNRLDFATVVRELAPIYRLDGRQKIEDQEALGLSPSVTNPNPMSGHDPIIYLKSATMAKVLYHLLIA